jgi:hypothetical protein
MRYWLAIQQFAEQVPAENTGYVPKIKGFSAFSSSK